MDIVNTLTLRHIKTHKKRSILTVLAIIVSVAMVSAVFTSAISFVKYFQNVTLAIDGDWHAKFEDTDYLNHKSIYEKDENIEKYAVRTYVGVTQISENQTSGDQFDIFSANQDFWEMRNIVVSKGRYPQNSNEMLVCENALKNKNYDFRLGEKIKLNVIIEGGKVAEKEYLVVGYTNSKVSATDSSPLITGIDNSSFENVDSALVYVKYDKLDNGIWNKISNTEKAVGAAEYSCNRELFTYSGIMKDNTMLKSLGGFAGILLLIIAVVSIFMIYDSFAVSYQERARYLGMLASVGATKKQKRKSIYFEGFIFGLIGIPIGIASGIGGIAVTFKFIEKAFIETMAFEYDGALRVYINWMVIVGTILASAITIFISSYIPARKASKETAIEAIRRNNTVKVKKAKKLRASKLTGKVFGYEGVIAVKNFKRNAKRSRNIVFALALSVIVFLTVSNFSAMFADVMSASYNMSADSTISVYYNNEDKLEQVVSKNKDVTKYYIDIIEFSRVDNSLFKDGEAEKIRLGNCNCLVAFLDNASFDGYLKEIGEDTSKYHDKSNPTAILQNISYQSDDDKRITVRPIKDITGKKIDAGIEVYQDEKGSSSFKDISFTVGAQTDKTWSEESYSYQYSKWPIFFMSMDFANEFVNNEFNPKIYSTAAVFCDNDKTETVIDSIKSELESMGNIEVFTEEIGAEMQSVNNLLTIAKVFIFGFITLITIISIMNIINTISNSMNERRREFAMIRSVGMTPKAFKKMVYMEAFRYGSKSLLFSIPLSILIHFGMYKALSGSFDYGFKIHFIPYLISIIAVFAIIGLALLYSANKINDDNIIETLKADID